ncbi:MAG TPA: hypothetical protein VNF47_22255, partial [Streptosporangiaceae bacterium]|nr:hypothetical protein [Streptosporangiaceae bacterium]
CQTAETRFGLRRTAPGDRTAASRPTRAESEKARRRGWQEPPRVTLKREVSTAAATASSEQEFFARLEAAGMLVRKRYSTRNPDEVTGYAVALPQDTTVAGRPVWFSGGKLAADLTLPKLRQRWADADDPRHTPGAPAETFTAAERAAIWEHAARVAAEAAAQVRYAAADDPATAADAAWAASDTLHAAAAALGSRVIREAATAYDRAARAPYGRIPRRTPTRTGLRRAARLLSAAAFVGHDRTLAQAALITRLAALAEAVTELRLTQQHAAQAAAARSAAERLRAAAVTVNPSASAPEPRPARSASSLAREAFPQARPSRPTRAGTRPHPAAQPAPRPRRRPGPARPRGPGR